MRKFLFRSLLYAGLIFLFLECMVRIFHLHRDTPYRYIDERKVEKWVPEQKGYSVTGNRKQNYSEYRINKSGYNSYREFDPSSDGFEIALVGDSFIEGFHQPYYNSIGKKMEGMRPGIEVYEYGYAGYDLADQLHLITAYEDQFHLIDRVVIYLKYPEDLIRDKHMISQDRIRLESGIYRVLKRSKLLVYLQNIGLIGVVSSKVSLLKNYILGIELSYQIDKKPDAQELEDRYLDNFIKLTDTFYFDKDRFVILLDARDYPTGFLTFLNNNGYNYIDYGKSLASSDEAVTLIYDQHWNDHGRHLVAKAIIDKLLPEKTTSGKSD